MRRVLRPIKGYPARPTICVRFGVISGQGTGFDVKHDPEIYRVQEEDDLSVVGTSEVALAGYHADEIIDVTEPVRYAGWSSCYRRGAPVTSWVAG